MNDARHLRAQAKRLLEAAEKRGDRVAARRPQAEASGFLDPTAEFESSSALDMKS